MRKKKQKTMSDAILWAMNIFGLANNYYTGLKSDVNNYYVTVPGILGEHFRAQIYCVVSTVCTQVVSLAMPPTYFYFHLFVSENRTQ